jgi:ubiquinone/menaquinone biosynthesis C-methylase UbiE
MRQRLRPRVAAVAFPVEIVPIRAESLPFVDNTFDAVVASLMLCSVESPARALREIWRVLKPTGRFRFMEHVQASGVGGFVLDAIAPAWGFCGGGCHPNRQTEQAIRDADFVITAIERYQLGLLPHIQGEAVKSREKTVDPDC